MSHLHDALRLGSPEEVRDFIAKSSKYDFKQGLNYSNSCKLRRWASAFVPMTFDPLCLIDLVLPDPCSKPLHILMPELANRKGAFWCGGTADTLTRIYRLFGFRALSANIGNPDDGLSHMFTLVEIENDGERIVIPQDAYFNTTIVATGERILDYNEIFELLKTGNLGNLAFAPQKTKKVYLSQCSPGGPKLCRTIRTFFWDDINWKNWLKKINGEENLLLAYLYPFELYEDSASADIKNRYQYMLRRSPY